MSTNYTCNQFEKAYIPTRLGNWEVPKWHINRPKGRSTVTKVIANDRGHLLPGVQKADQKHWAGLYLGTYQLPKRISKEIAIELTNPKCQTWMKRSYHHPFIDRNQQNKNNQLENTDSKEQPIINEEIDRDSIKSIKSANSYVPAADVSTTLPVRDCASADGLMKTTGDDGKHRMGRTGNAKTPSSPALSRISAGDGNDDRIRETAENPRPAPPGRRHGDAQMHHRLPDAIEDAVYRSLQMKRNKHPAGLGLNDCWPKCSAVAYKSFNDPGPTQCSKLRIYRPKTSSSSSSTDAAAEAGDGGKKDSARRRDGKNPQRPRTCVPVVTAQQLTDIKLALCWDLDAPLDRNRPPRPPDEPAVFHKVQRPGGEGTGQPQPQPRNSSAVMGFVKATAAENRDDDVVPEARQTQTHECLMKNRNLSAVMELIPNKDGDRTGTKTAAAGRNDDVTAAVDRSLLNKPRSSSSSSSSLARRSNGSSDGNDRDDNESNDKRSNDKLADDDDDNILNGARLRRRSSADLSSSHRRRHQEAAVKKGTTSRQRHVCRPCLACDNLTAVAAAANKKADCDAERNRYKMAFKAGVPVSTPVKNRTAAAGKPARLLKVPKPKTTNSDKKKYVIGTLLPPFSMWPGTTARDYPEHWRLTSVYRQAFKPLELRKQPLLQTVYL